MKKLNIILENELLTLLSDREPRRLQKQFPVAKMRPFLVAIILSAMVRAAVGQVVGSLDLGNSLTGLDQNGNPAIYDFEVGYTDPAYNEIFYAESTLSAASIGPFSVAGLLTATYNNMEAQLPAPLQSDLTLDLADDAINFAFEAGITEPTVGGYSTDSGYLTAFSTGLTTAGDANFSLNLKVGAYDGKQRITLGSGTMDFYMTDGQELSQAQNTLTLLGAADFQTVTGSDGSQTLLFTCPVTTFESSVGTKDVDVPEPSTLALLGMGGVSLLANTWRRRMAMA